MLGPGINSPRAFHRCCKATVRAFTPEAFGRRVGATGGGLDVPIPAPVSVTPCQPHDAVLISRLLDGKGVVGIGAPNPSGEGALGADALHDAGLLGQGFWRSLDEFEGDGRFFGIVLDGGGLVEAVALEKRGG